MVSIETHGMAGALPGPLGVVDYWRQAGPSKWFKADPLFDEDFKGRFLDAHFAAARRDLDEWIQSPDGALALMILLDQFPRNAFRGTAHMYATDSLARHCARTAIEAGLHRAHDGALKQFFYLPFEHSEDLADQERCLALAEELGGEFLRYAVLHHEIIVRFGRFPHRNAVLGRTTTAAEQEFLDAGGFAG